MYKRTNKILWNGIEIFVSILYSKINIYSLKTDFQSILCAG